MKAYKVNRTAGDQELENNSRVEIYEGYTALYNDLDNLKEGQIVGLVSNVEIPQPVAPEDGSMIYYDSDAEEYVASRGPDGNNKVLTARIDPVTSKVSFEWKKGGAGTVARFATLAEAEAALALDEDDDNYIPDQSLVIVDELNPVFGSEDAE